jgi:hypothetical protein
MRMCHPHDEDDTAQNHYDILVCLKMMLGNPMNYYVLEDDPGILEMLASTVPSSC